MALETFKKVAPLIALVATIGCVDKPKEDIALLTCDELRTRITRIIERESTAISFEGRAMEEQGKQEVIEKLQLVQRAKNCK